MIGTGVEYYFGSSGGTMSKTITAAETGNVYQDDDLKGCKVIMIASHNDNQIYLKGFLVNAETGVISNYYMGQNEQHTIFYTKQ